MRLTSKECRRSPGMLLSLPFCLSVCPSLCVPLCTSALTRSPVNVTLSYTRWRTHRQLRGFALYRPFVRYALSLASWIVYVRPARRIQPARLAHPFPSPSQQLTRLPGPAKLLWRGCERRTIENQYDNTATRALHIICRCFTRSPRPHLLKKKTNERLSLEL